MENTKRQPKNNYTNINITAYRAIKILKMLIEKPCSGAEIISSLQNDEITSKSTSDDTLRITLNSLKSAGCKIARPCSRNGNKYILISHPFKQIFTKSEIKILNKIRNDFVLENNWKKVFAINDLLEKIIDLTADESSTELIRYKKPFGKIKKEIREFLLTTDVQNKEIIMTYATSSKKKEAINILSKKVFCEAGRIYILGWYPKRNNFAYFNAEKITEIHSVKPLKNADIKDFSKALYKISGDDAKIFQPNYDEKIIKKEKDYIIVENTVQSDFKLFQRVLSFGSDCELLEPAELKMKFAEKLKKMRARYEK